MKEISDFNKLEFKKWNDISYDGKTINKWWGKTYFYYDKSKGKLFFDTFSPFSRAIHFIFGFKKEFNRTNLWDYLKAKKIVKDECPKKDVFRKIVAETLGTSRKQKETYFNAKWSTSDEQLIQLFENGMDINSSYNGDTALFDAAHRGRAKVVEYLLQRGAEVNPLVSKEINWVAVTPLQAALAIQHEKIVLALLDRGADVNVSNFNGYNALHIAIRNLERPQQSNDGTITNHYPGEDKEPPKQPKKIIQAILQKQIDDINDQGATKKGPTPLHLACEFGDVEVVRWLVEKGADISRVTDGKTPLDWARDKQKIEIIGYLESLSKK